MGRKVQKQNKLPKEKEDLVLDNLALVTWLIKKYIYVESKDYEDVFQEGCVGLVKAARNFDENRGIKFSTFASTYILGTIQIYQRENGSNFHGIKVGRRVLDNLFKVQTLKSKDMTDDEIAKELGLDKKDIEKTYIYINSLDKYINSTDENTITLADTLESIETGYDELIGEETFDSILTKLKGVLSDKNYNIAEELIYAYTIGGEKLTQVELSIKYKCSQAQISRTLKCIREELLKIVEQS